MAFFVDFALFFRTIDGLLRYGTLNNSDKNVLAIVSQKLHSSIYIGYKICSFDQCWDIFLKNKNEKKREKPRFFPKE
jgi:hypothetical protein